MWNIVVVLAVRDVFFLFHLPSDKKLLSQKTMHNIKISVIGCGYWGKNLVRNFSELGVLTSVCDVNAELVESTAKTY